MGRIVWSDGALEVMKRLDPTSRREIEHRTEYLKRMPRMYALSQDELFFGCRSFWAGPTCHVYYMVAAGGDDCYIMAVEELDPDDVIGDDAELER